jgi:hypothetical protein
VKKRQVSAIYNRITFETEKSLMISENNSFSREGPTIQHKNWIRQKYSNTRELARRRRYPL